MITHLMISFAVGMKQAMQQTAGGQGWRLYSTKIANYDFLKV